MNKDGTGVTQLTFNTTHDYSPSFSDDGSVVIFTSNRNGNREIIVQEGIFEANITNNAANDTEPAFSPDGTKIAFTSDRGNNIDIYTMNADGTGTPTNLTNTPAT